MTIISDTSLQIPNIANPRSAGDLIAAYDYVRAFTEQLCEPLATEDYVIQTMPDVSPTKWHLAHTTWFWETFVLNKYAKNHAPFHPQFAYLFNSYYNSAGPQFCRPRRGVLSRPTVEEVYQYRAYVDEQMRRVIDTLVDKHRDLAAILVLGLHHEQQHQELMVTDIKHVFATNPLMPAYADRPANGAGAIPSMQWIHHESGMAEVGHRGDTFAFDNELPRHSTYLQPFQFASRLVTNGEFMEFIEDGGYEHHHLWLSDGWKIVREQNASCPMYWHKQEGQWFHYTLNGYRQINRNEPACHVSYYEADAFARWAGARLPSEFEWEVTAAGLDVGGNFVESARFHPTASHDLESKVVQMYGDVWEWTSSSYAPYPGFKTAEGAVGEYNAKFMCNQYVLRGGSCATSRAHVRPTYRNFFPPNAQWQFTSIRLAKDA